MEARILDSLAEGVLALDAAGRIRFANPAAAQMLGYAVADLLGQDGHALLHHSHVDGTPYAADECPTRATLEEARVVRVPARDGEVLWRRDGSSFPVHYVSAPLLVAGKPLGAAIVFTDATERLRRQDERVAGHREAAKSEKLAALGTLVSGVSHEIKTPLTILLNHVFLARQDLAQRAAESPEAAALAEALEAHFAEIESAADRMKSLVGELRRFSRIDTTESAPMLLEEVVAEAANLFRLAYAGTVRVDVDLHETRPALLDPHKVQQLTMNLLQNAVEATADHGGCVRVGTRLAGERALLLVEDDGEGIPEEVQPRMYEPLYTTKEHGTGLGLAIVKRIADEHGATLRCDSAPGKGTIFTVAFPVARYE